MIWKDQVNILNQTRIFKLLAKGPRLDSYLTQLKRAEKLDFASWGGFAQNFAGRRIPFEHQTSTKIWERAQVENLFIPTFAAGLDGPYIPGSAFKGAIRTGLVFSRWNAGVMKELAERMQGDNPLRKPGEAVEEHLLGAPGVNRMKSVSAGDSEPVPVSTMKIYLTRVSTLQSRAGKLSLGWKQSPRGTVDGGRADDSTPTFAEMAAPGTVFEGGWSEKAFFNTPEVTRALRWREASTSNSLAKAANAYAEALLGHELHYAEVAGLDRVKSSLEELRERLDGIRQNPRACLVSIGWGGGLLAKSAFLDTNEDAYRDMMRRNPLYSRAIQTGLPFPKTRRIIFAGNEPAMLPGWSLVEFED
jgi:CRISPR-associated protein Csm5